MKDGIRWICRSDPKENIPHSDGVMKLIELLEKNKENLLTALAEAGTAEKAVIVMENELDRLLMMYNEHCGSERERNAAAHMLQAVRLSLPLIDSRGETKVWETGSSDPGKGRPNPLVFILIIAGLVLCCAGLLPLIVEVQDAGRHMDLLKTSTLELGGLAAVFLAGLLSRRSAKKAPKRSHRVEVMADPERIYRSFRNAVLSVDQNLEEVRSMEKQEAGSGAAAEGGLSAQELELFSDLLAAAYSRDPDYAMEKIEAVRYYLHRRNIETVDYSGKNAAFFDLMPGQMAGTIRPALVSDGELIRKGVASAGMK